MKQKLNNYPCLWCGHPKDQHRSAWDWTDGDDACMISNNDPLFHYCSFKPDNLKYLEKQYEYHNK